MKLLVPAILLLATACNGRASGPDPHTANVGPWAGAYTTWDCRYTEPVSWVRSDVVEDGAFVPVLVHEAKHREQAKEAGCRMWKLLLADPGFRLRMEAEAFCAQAKAMHEVGDTYSVTQAVRQLAPALAANYGFGISVGEATRRIQAQGCT